MIMTTKPETRKAPAANGAELDPVFAAITEHKVLIKESDRLEDSFMTAMAKAEKKYGKWARAPDQAMNIVCRVIEGIEVLLNGPPALLDQAKSFSRSPRWSTLTRT